MPLTPSLKDELIAYQKARIEALTHRVKTLEELNLIIPEEDVL